LLILSRRTDESIVIGDEVTITILSVMLVCIERKYISEFNLVSQLKTPIHNLQTSWTISQFGLAQVNITVSKTIVIVQ